LGKAHVKERGMRIKRIDLFAFGINYNEGANPQYNGNISGVEWLTASDNVQRSYGYTYDPFNRITSATASNANYSLSLVEYDKMGNITRLTRNGHRDVGATTFGLMDDLTYQYSGNQLTSIDDAPAASAVTGFIDGAETTDEYGFDANGNMVRDDNKDITLVEYNHLNMPTGITVTGSNAGTLDYVYSASGAKLRKTNSNGTVTDYDGNYVYENGNLKQISHPEGYLEPDGSGGYDYVYYLKDHQNNVRVTFADGNGNGSIDASTEIRREQNYYPFGLEHKGYNDAIYGVKNNLKTFQDQELTEDLGLNTHEWRYRVSDPSMGRFWQVDPLATDYTHNSPYAFSENRVVNGVELEGLEYATYGYNETGARANVQATAQRSTRTQTEKDQEAAQTLDLIPGVGDVKGLIETFTGTDLVTGESLSFGSRVLGLFLLSELRVVETVSDASKAVKQGTKNGERAGKDFTKKGKQEVIDANKQQNAGQTVCEDCGTSTVPAKKSEKGVTPPGNETQVDHIYPKSKGGDGASSNGQVLCRDCNRAKGDKTPDEHYKREN